MRILGIESSCDETAAAVVDDGRRVCSDVVSTQIEIHRRWGGVIPELASRNHLVQVLPVIDEALARASVSLGGVDAIAVTSGPGLIGALLVGVQVAKSLALATGKPLVGVNHLHGHLCAALLEERAPELPYLGLVVSGGHTALYEVRADSCRMLGTTRDDAAGEAYDKVGKLLGLPYPAGKEIDALAQSGDPAAIRFPRALPGENLEFSFSGLKTAVLHHVQQNGQTAGQALADLCASFQEAVCDVLSKKAVAAARRQGLSRLVLCGGVAANSRLRSLTGARAESAGLELYLPRPAYCTDNAAMIAAAGYQVLQHGPPNAIKANASWRLG